MNKVGFVGVGKLGKDVAEVIAESYDVTGFDIRPVNTSIKMADSLKECVSGKDYVFIAVPTPHHPDYDGRFSTSHLPSKDFDYSIVINVMKEIDLHVAKNTLVILISTMLPGTVRREIVPLINNSRFIYNPYLIAQGTVKYDMKNPEMIMIGTEDGSTTGDAKSLSNFYQPLLEKETRIEIGTWEEVESMKIFYNTFITAKLCLVNMIQDVAMNLGNMNVDKVTEALRNSTDRIMGPKYMTAGLGDGGGCHPRDNIALIEFAKTKNLGYDLFSTIVSTREKQALNVAKFFQKIGVETDETICILGTGFKPGVNQLEGSPSILVGHFLEKIGYQVEYDLIEDKNGNVRDNPKVNNINSFKVFLLGWPKSFNNWTFPQGSIIVDVWRSFSPKEGLKVYHYGNTRNNKLGLIS